MSTTRREPPSYTAQHEKIERMVLEMIELERERYEEVNELLQELKEKITLDLTSIGINARVEIQGSFVRDTYLPEENTYDLLIILQKSDKSSIHQILDSLAQRLSNDRLRRKPLEVKKITGKTPYLRILGAGERFHVFIAFEYRAGDKPMSMFDIVPLHTQYVLTHMKEKQKREVLLLKKFVHAINVYREEVGAIGVNGYLCELLILHYGSFRKTLQAIINWKPRTIIDIKRNKEKFEDVDQLSVELLHGYYPLYVPDPIEPRMNVASEVTLDQFYSLIGAATYFLYKPSISFFEELECELPSFEDLAQKIALSEREIIVMLLPRNFQDPGVCWEKAQVMKRAFEEELIKHNYVIERTRPFVSDEYYGVLMSLASPIPKLALRREGPEINSKDSIAFLEKYTKHTDVIAGPFVDYGRWIVYFSKKGQHVYDFLYLLAKKNTFVLNVDSFLKLEIREKMQLLTIDKELRDVYNSDQEFAEVLYVFVTRKPLWLCNVEAIKDIENE
ncbi:MAG: hypothetical protein ACTSYD_12775 [Candidatus Heimdallarchaeaceae archaeon]